LSDSGAECAAAGPGWYRIRVHSNYIQPWVSNFETYILDKPLEVA
jgi:hypothetical protein